MHRRGFTIVELIIVIGIVALTASFLFPVFTQARGKARQVACLSNTKQIGTALLMYAQDYDEVYPSPWPFSGAGKYDWDHTFHEVIQPYLKNPAVTFCPSMDPKTYVSRPNVETGVQGGNAICYLMNETGWSAKPPSPDGARPGISLAAIARPADVILITEAMGIDNGAGSYSWQDAQVGYTDADHAGWGGSPYPAPDQKLTWHDFYNAPGCDWGKAAIPITMSTRHDGANNCVFYDGHAKAMRDSQGSDWLAEWWGE